MMMVTNRLFITNKENSPNKVIMNKEQLTGAISTLEQWNHTQRCRFIERLLPLCSSDQLDMLWTVLQPSLHRDYYYTVKSHYPDYHFKRINIPNTRAVKNCKHQDINEEDSFYLSNVNDLREFRDDDGDDGRPSQSPSVFRK